MRERPTRVFLDTNVYIIGSAFSDSPEAAILEWCGFDKDFVSDVEVIVSNVTFEQIRNVARRLRGKDWAGQILMRIWRFMNVRFVIIDEQAIENLTHREVIPREDVAIFLAAQAGQAECFVSSNRELIRAAAEQSGTFECLTPEAFVAAYIATPRE